MGKAPNVASTLYGSKFTQVQKEKMKKVETDREREKKAMMKRKGRNTEMEWGEGRMGVGALKNLDMRVEGFKDRLHARKK